jgi:hypothetical protein
MQKSPAILSSDAPAKGDSRRKFSRNIQAGSTSALMHRWRFAETALISTHISARIRTAPLHHSRRHDLRECPSGNIYFLEINAISPFLIATGPRAAGSCRCPGRSMPHAISQKAQRIEKPGKNAPGRQFRGWLSDAAGLR